LFELALEKKVLETVEKEVAVFASLLDGDERLQHFFLSPELGADEKKTAVEKSLQDRFTALFINFLLILLEKRRQNLFVDIADEFTRMCDVHFHRVKAVAITAVPLGKKDLANIQKSLAKQFDSSFEVESVADPSILGGLILKIGGQVLDASVGSQLNRLKERLYEGRN
jgi:F-type H+-transporting ATPase subunit delta